MSLIFLEDLAKSYQGELLFQDITFQINKNDKIGLIGNNGTGKTTLLDLVCGQKEPDRGRVLRTTRYSLGYLPQTLAWTREGQIGDYLWEAFQDLVAIHEELRDLEEKISETHQAHLLERYAVLREEYEEKGGYSCESRIRGVLNGLGFPGNTMERPLTDFSGGEKTKIALSRLLLEEPDILLLDEPTNHLDRENREWLASYLKDYPGSLLIVSHDRYFLDQVVNKIFELEDQRLYSYEGDYSAYRQQREIIIKSWRRSYEKQQEEIAALEDFVRRYKAGQRTREARARERQLERMEIIAPPPRPRKKINITFPLDAASGKEVLKVKGLTIARNGRILLKDFTGNLYRNDKVALLGPNGAGKTTILKSLLGGGPASDGSIVWGHGVKLGYFDQEGGPLAETKSLFNAVADAGLNYKQDIMDLLGAFRFSGDEVNKTLGQLSGGERARLNLALLTLKAANVLLLDEPTNHLDLALQEWLGESLSKYKGTVIFTSHDRYFIETVATMYWKLYNGRILVFKGSYSDFLLWEKEIETTPIEAPLQKKQSSKKISPAPAVKGGLGRKTKEKLLAIEEKISILEKEIKALEEMFSKSQIYENPCSISDITKEYHLKKERLNELYDSWEKIFNL